MTKLIPGRLYELQQDANIRTDINSFSEFKKVEKGNMVLWISEGPEGRHTFLYKNNTCCFQFLFDALRLNELLKLVV